MNRSKLFTSALRKLPKYLLFSWIYCLALAATAQVSANPEVGAPNQMASMVEESAVFSKIFTGFALYDPETDHYIYEKENDKNITPASNTKLLTFYTALKVLGDSLPAVRYVQAGDTVVLWGTGNPLLFHPAFPQDTTLLKTLKSLPGRLFFSGHNFQDERFGPGWSWRDYNYYYQTEKSPMPLYGNMVSFERERTASGFEVTPKYFRSSIVYNPEMDNRRPDIRRREHSNVFEYNSAAMTGLPFDRARPYRYSPEVVCALLSEALERPVDVLDLRQLPPQDVRALFMATPDTLYRRLMRHSDNFIAEQLLLMVSDKLYGVQKTEMAIDYALDSLFYDMPDKLVWTDGSGLSRYNLFTPRSIIRTLHLIYHALPRERLFKIFPAGGVNGTIEDWYHGTNGRPYVFAKTGTLSNKHALSGYLLARSGKILLFSFMHNNYVNGSNEVKEEMERVLNYVYNSY